MKILYLSHRIPYPPNKGDKIRSFNEIKYLSKRHEIHLACLADDPKDLRYEEALQNYCSVTNVFRLKVSVAKIRGMASLLLGNSLSVGYFYSDRLQKKIDQLIKSNDYGAIFCFSSPMAEYLFKCHSAERLFHSGCDKKATIMDFCDVDSEKWLQYSKSARLPMRMLYRIESKRLLKYESKINRMFSASIFVTAQESELFRNAFPSASRIYSISNGVDYDFFSPDATPLEPVVSSNASKKAVLVFTGAMDYHANIDGVVWFSDHIFPSIRKKFPDARFYIVGSNPDQKVLALRERPGIEVTGFVEDIRPYYKGADVCVIPLRLARGVQNKILEAMAMGKPVVATEKSAKGTSAVPGRHLLAESDPGRFAKAVSKIIEHPKEGSRLGEEARKFVIDNYAWEKNMTKLEALLK